MNPLPCPFCGGTEVVLREGSTFRWRMIGCTECGAQAGEVRVQTLGDGTPEEWEADAASRAIEEWNGRAPVVLPPHDDPTSDPWLHEYAERYARAALAQYGIVDRQEDAA